MDHRMIRRTLAERLARFRQADLPIELYSHQDETLDKMQAWLANPNGSRRAYVAHATGLGKTILFASLLRFCEGLRVLVVVSTKTLVDQTVRTLAKFTTGRLVHMSSLPNILDDDDNVLARRWRDQAFDVLVTTDESFKTKRGRERLKAFNPHLIIWDECHWAYTEKAQSALAPFPEAVVLAFSATPDFLTNVCKNDYAPVTLDNGQVLYGTPDRFARTHFGDLLDERGARWGIENDFLAPLAWGRLEFSFSLEGVRTVEGPGGMDYDQAALSRILAKNWPFVVETICKLYRSEQYGLAARFSAAICPGVKQAYEITEALNGIGVPSACITASTPDTDRRDILQAGEAGELAFLGSVFALREGWDSPRAEVAMMLRPTKSRVLYMQFMGRVLRKFGDKIALVLDPHYQNTRFAPLSAPVLFGRPGQEVREGDILVGPKTGSKTRRVVPPWLRGEKLGLLEPTLVVEKIEIEYKAGPDGTFEADGETWASMYALTRILQLSHNALKNRMKSVRSRPGGTSSRISTPFFAVSDVRKACADLLEDLPRAGEDGILNIDGEQWVTVEGLFRLTGIATNAFTKRVGACRQRPGRHPSGNRRDFYALSDVKAICGDLFEDLPKAGPNGSFRADRKVWVTISAAPGLLGKLSEPSVKARMTKGQYATMKGRSYGGTVCTFYALPDIKKACADLLEDLPRAAKDGQFKKDRETWMSMPALERLTGATSSSIQSRVKTVRTRNGRSAGGLRCTFYALSDVRKACADLFEDLPRAGTHATFEADGQVWGTVSHWANEMDVDFNRLRSRLGSYQTQKGKDTGGHIRPFYALSDVRKACVDLPKKGTSRASRPKK